MHFQPTFIMAYICPTTLHMPRILLIPMYVFQILQDACRITKGIPYGRARNGITMGCDRIPSTTPGAEPPRDAKDSGSARSHSTHLETSSSNRP